LSPKLPRLRFYLDENFPVSAGKFLKSMRQNVISAVETKHTRKKSDAWQLKYAIKHNRILLVLDKDFSFQKQLLGLAGKSMGVILVKNSDPSSKQWINIFSKLLKSISQTKISGKICIASIDKIKYMNPNKVR